MREYLEELEQQILSPLGVKSTESKGRKFKENLDVTRTCFQRDRDRIVHSKSFRRLKHKTQVFNSIDKDHVRSRLTHSIEVAQISRHMSRLLRLNEDLTEAIALSHDLGHPPFGHAGESSLNELMSDYGGFEHNLQSLRIIEFLESKYPQFDGLNLTYEVRSGLNKHSRKMQNTLGDWPDFISLEAQVVNLSDEIAYTSHDVDDAIRADIIQNDAIIDSVVIWKELDKVVRDQFSNLSTIQYLYLMNSKLITSQIMNAMTNSKECIRRSGIQSIHDLQSSNSIELIGFSTEFSEKISQLKTFLMEHFYTNHDIYRSNKRGQMVLKDLFNVLISDIKLIPKSYRKKFENESNYRIVCDYVSGMTDSFALSEHALLIS